MTNSQAEHCEAAINYGLGWTVSERGSTFSHSGSDGTYVWVDWNRDLIGMLLRQCNGTKPPRSEFRILVESACVPSAPRVDKIDGKWSSETPKRQLGSTGCSVPRSAKLTTPAILSLNLVQRLGVVSLRSVRVLRLGSATQY